MDYINCNVATNVDDDTKPKAPRDVETKEALVLDAPTKDEPTWKRNLAKICAFDVARLDEVVGGGGAHGCAYNRLVNEDFDFLGDNLRPKRCKESPGADFAAGFGAGVVSAETKPR